MFAPMNNWSRRPEVWVLLIGSLGIAFWAMKPAHDPAGWSAGDGSASLPSSENASAQLVIGELVRDYGNARLDLMVRIRNEGVHPLLLTPPKTRLLADQQEVPAFFLPSERPPEVAAKMTSEVKLRYWLESAHLLKPLVLEVNGESLPVKSAKPFDLNQLENGKPRLLHGVDW